MLIDIINMHNSLSPPPGLLPTSINYMHAEESTDSNSNVHEITIKMKNMMRYNNGGVDLVLYDHPIFRKNIHSAYIGLVKTGSQDKSYNGLLRGRRYSIIVNETVIYSSVLGPGNIFPINNIPMHLAQYSAILFVVHDVSDMIFIASDIRLSVKVVESNIMDFEKVNRNDNTEYLGKRFPPYIYGAKDQNRLLFNSGLVGNTHSYVQIDRFYRDSAMSTGSTDKCSYKLFSHIDNDNNLRSGSRYYQDQYSCGIPVHLLVGTPPCDFIVETIKIPLCGNVTYYHENIHSAVVRMRLYSVGDSIAGVSIMSDKQVMSVKMHSDVFATDMIPVTGNNGVYDLPLLSIQKQLNTVLEKSIYLIVQFDEHVHSFKGTNVILRRTFHDSHMRRELANMAKNKTPFNSDVNDMIVDVDTVKGSISGNNNFFGWDDNSSVYFQTPKSSKKKNIMDIKGIVSTPKTMIASPCSVKSYVEPIESCAVTTDDELFVKLKKKSKSKSKSKKKFRKKKKHKKAKKNYSVDSLNSDFSIISSGESECVSPKSHYIYNSDSDSSHHSFSSYTDLKAYREKKMERKLKKLTRRKKKAAAEKKKKADLTIKKSGHTVLKL